MLDKSVLDLNNSMAKRCICNFIKQKARAHAGVVLGLSGGIDSALCAKLCVEALGADRVHAMVLPSEFTPAQDTADAKELAASLGIQAKEISIKPIMDCVIGQVPDGLFTTKMAKGNIQARIRMLLLYNEASSQKGLVIGTGNKSELLQGYFTKYGDGGCDLLPIGGLYKTQVRSLAKFMGMGGKLIEKKPSAGLWPGQTDEDELGISYENLDLVLYGYNEKKMPAAKIASSLNIGRELVDRAIGNMQDTRHKRELVPIAELKFDEPQ